MGDPAQRLLTAVRDTVSAVFQSNFTRICEVKKAVLQLEAIYFCHSTCCLLGRGHMTLEKQLALYQEIGLLPPDTAVFFEENRIPILENWPEASVFAEKPELLYEALLSSELCMETDSIAYREDKVSRDIAGAYYTSAAFSGQITRRALERRMEGDGSGSDASRRGFAGDEIFLDYACGCGEFLLAVIRYFADRFPEVPLRTLALRLRGVDVDPLARMVAVARIVSCVGAETDDELLRGVAEHFILGNPLLHRETPATLGERFENFALNRLYAPTEGIDCLALVQENLIVLGNPPWEKLRFEERAFFRPLCPRISGISQKNRRAGEIEKLAVEWPELLEYYRLVQADYAAVKKMIPKHPLLHMSLVGELNTYALFAELASRLTEKNGFAAIIVKSALVTSTCYSACFRHFVEQGRLSEVFLFDNRERIFQIDSREKFCVLFFGGGQPHELRVHYGLTGQAQLATSVPLGVTADELALINPETGLLPNVTDADAFAFLLRAHRSLPVFAQEFPQCHFGRLVHLTAHAEHIATESGAAGVPIYEGKFIEQYDNRYSTFAEVPSSARYQAKASARRQDGDPFLVQKSAPECRYFVDRDFWGTFLKRYDQPYSLCWRSLTSPGNQRTMIASILPTMPTCQSIQMLQASSNGELLRILALFNSKVFDYFVRLKMAGIDLTQSVVRQIPVPHRVAWERPVRLHGDEFTAADAVCALEKLLYRHEPALAGLWNGVPDIRDADTRYHSALEVREEIDRLLFRLYDLTDAEEQMIRGAFKA